MKLFATTALGGAFLVSATMSAHAISIVSAIGSCDPANPIPVSFASFTSQCSSDANRTKIGNVNLGAADGAFYSLGLNQTPGQFGGLAIFELDPAFVGPAMVVEVTNPSDHKEAANVYVANSLTELRGKYFAGDVVGTVDNGEGGITTANNTVTFSGAYTYIAFEDVSHIVYGVADNGTIDGFDLDSFTVTAVPVPAGALLLGTALLGLGLSRRHA